MSEALPVPSPAARKEISRNLPSSWRHHGICVARAYCTRKCPLHTSVCSGGSASTSALSRDVGIAATISSRPQARGGLVLNLLGTKSGCRRLKPCCNRWETAGSRSTTDAPAGGKPYLREGPSSLMHVLTVQSIARFDPPCVKTA